MNWYNTATQTNARVEQGNWTDNQRQEIKQLIAGSLDHAEGIWKQVGPEFKSLDLAEGRAAFSKVAANMPTLIPSHEIIDPAVPQVSDFVAFALDIRGSTKHLLQLRRGGQVQQLERVLYETFGLLPACSRVLEYGQGRTTEYLGDGILGIFHAPEEDREKLRSALRGATQSGWKCLDVRRWVNDELDLRYDLPSLDIGIGIAWSKAVVTVIGHSKNDLHPKVMGECVYRATKWADGVNEIQTDERTHNVWPTTKGGRLRFIQRSRAHGIGYLIGRSST